MFLKATRLKLRWATSRGYLTIEDLWDLSLQNLNQLAKTLKKEIKIQEEEDFLEESKEEDTITKLKFDIVLEILNIKKKEYHTSKEAAANKEHNQKILGIIAAKENEELTNKSIEELKQMLK